MEASRKNLLKMNKKIANNGINDFNLKSYLKEQQEIINNKLRKVLSLYDIKRGLIAAMEYSLMANGKRLRPILCIAAAQCIGTNNQKSKEKAMLPACAIEMIHTYSLIHDDLPAMDDDDFRRGNPTLHKKFSEATAILAGDALLTHAFSILSNPLQHTFKPLSSDALVKIISIISDAAGTNGMVEGQVLDMAASLTIESIEPFEYIKHMHALKTGELIIASVKTGGVAAGADPDQLKQLVVYARNIGMAFQIIDDILDIEGDSAVMGKQAGSDEANKKLTFPQVIGLKASKEYAKKLVSDALKSLESFEEKALPLEKIAQYIIERKY